MRKLGFILTLVTTLLFTQFISNTSLAAAVSASPYRVIYDHSNVTSSAWYEVVASTLKAIKGITILNSNSVAGLYVAVGASGEEVAQLIIPQGQSVVYVPMVVSGFQRISIKALQSTGATGELQMNLLYN